MAHLDMGRRLVLFPVGKKEPPQASERESARVPGVTEVDHWGCDQVEEDPEETGRRQHEMWCRRSAPASQKKLSCI